MGEHAVIWRDEDVNYLLELSDLINLWKLSLCRMEGSQLESRDENKMWLVRHLEILRQLMIDDLKVVKVDEVSFIPIWKFVYSV